MTTIFYLLENTSSTVHIHVSILQDSSYRKTLLSSSLSVLVDSMSSISAILPHYMQALKEVSARGLERAVSNYSVRRYYDQKYKSGNFLRMLTFILLSGKAI